MFEIKCDMYMHISGCESKSNPTLVVVAAAAVVVVVVVTVICILQATS